MQFSNPTFSLTLGFSGNEKKIQQNQTQKPPLNSFELHNLLSKVTKKENNTFSRLILFSLATFSQQPNIALEK